MELRSLKSKKAAEMTIGTIIVIVLAIIVLVFLIFGFFSGWKNLWDKITNLGGGASNVDTVVLACKTACATNSKTDFCSVDRKVVFSGDKPNSGSFTCLELVNEVGINATGAYNMTVICTDADCNKFTAGVEPCSICA